MTYKHTKLHHWFHFSLVSFHLLASSVLQSVGWYCQAAKPVFIDFFVISVALFCFQRTFRHCSPMTTWVAVTARAHDWTWRTIHRSDFTILLIKGLMHHTSRLFITCCYMVNFFVVTPLSIQHQQAAEWVSNQFQMCITNLRIVRDRKKDITGGGKRLILTPRGFEKKYALKSACAQSREISARAGLDPQWGPSQKESGPPWGGGFWKKISTKHCDLQCFMHLKGLKRWWNANFLFLNPGRLWQNMHRHQKN